MRPQLFLNDGNAKFDEFVPLDAGDSFSASSLHRGRGLARLDWNRDGRDEFAVSHLDEPSALATNQSEFQGETLVLRFVGVESHRDAVGVSAVASSERDSEGVRQFWLTAGDGYQASNERRIVIHAGDHMELWAVAVRWPSGREQVFRGLRPRREWLLREGVEFGIATLRPDN